MSRGSVAVFASAVLFAVGACAGCSRDEGSPPIAVSAREAVPAAPPAEELALSDLLATDPPLRPSARTLALAGKRVRMVGFMAQMELPPKGAFYLVPQPVQCDEAGGGTADLPLASVLVVSKSAAGQTIEFISGLLEVTGILELGSRSDEEGRVSFIRLILDGPGPHPPGAASAAPPAPASR